MTLVDTKEYFEISWAGLRALVDPSLAPRIAWKHTSHLKDGAKLAVGSVARVSESAVVLEGGVSLPYDFLVLCPGAAGGMGKAMQKTLEERIAYFEAEAKRIAAASSVLIVGGGPTGIELAAEILAVFPGKKVTLVTSGAELIPALVPKAGAMLRAELIRMGCVVITGAKVAKTASGGFSGKTDQGHDVAADVVYDCTGSKPCTAFLASGHPAISLDAGGFIKVDKELRVAGTTNVFALGDAAATEDAKQGYLANTNQVPAVLANLLAAVQTPPGQAVAAKSGPHGMMLVTLGPTSGVAQFPGGYVVGGYWMGWLPAMIKSKGLFIDKIRGEFGLV